MKNGVDELGGELHTGVTTGLETENALYKFVKLYISAAGGGQGGVHPRHSWVWMPEH